MKVTETFVASIAGGAMRHFDSADEAVSFAGRHVYVTPDMKAASVELLNAGRLAQWAYGFNEVIIYPPGTEVR